MRTLLPSSRGFFKVSLAAFDILWAALSPLLALYFRGAYILASDGAATVALYCGISLAFSLIAFLAFRISDGVSRYFSVHDALNVVKAVVVAGVMTALVLFTFTRLEGIPRSTPVIHVLILAAGLIVFRTISLLRDRDGHLQGQPDHAAVTHIVMIGSNRLAALYIKFLRAYSPLHHRIIAILDDQPTLFGRAIVGVPVLGTPETLEPVIEEFAVHGIRTDRVIIAGDADLLSDAAFARVRRICQQREIDLDFVPRLIGLSELQVRQDNEPAVAQVHRYTVSSAPYFRCKRLFAVVVSAAAIVLVSPLLLLTSLLVLIDVGSPVLFWQQRVGRGGSSFLLYKFRTLRPPFDWHGRPVAENRRVSWIGRLVRKTRLDELPQLFNVLVGDMSLIGPRPLLPHDQPTTPSFRLSVRPGITGWAQINGGNLVTANEKAALDDWYIRNASLWLDLRIVVATLRVLFLGERRSEEAVREACAAAQTEVHDLKNALAGTPKLRHAGLVSAPRVRRTFAPVAAPSPARRAAVSIRPRQ
jgi:lipopolysaccharide/colanic/teichoic acid biosynthesis glycosyltransferase